MWLRFTEQSRLIILLAQEEAVAMDSALVGTAHLLLGLIREENSIPALIFQKAGVTLAQVKQEMAIEEDNEKSQKTTEPKLTPGAKRSLELAAREAMLMHYETILPEHLLLALFLGKEQDSPLTSVLKRFKGDSDTKSKKADVAASILSRLGFELGAVRQQIAGYYVAEQQ